MSRSGGRSKSRSKIKSKCFPTKKMIFGPPKGLLSPKRYIFGSKRVTFIVG